MSEKKRVLALLLAALTIGSVSCGSAAPIRRGDHIGCR